MFGKLGSSNYNMLLIGEDVLVNKNVFITCINYSIFMRFKLDSNIGEWVSV